MVNGCWMNREQYDMEGWHVVGNYQRDDGKPAIYWKAELGGLQRYGALIHARDEARKRERQTRREADDEASDYYASLADAKPDYGKGK